MLVILPYAMDPINASRKSCETFNHVPLAVSPKIPNDRVVVQRMIRYNPNGILHRLCICSVQEARLVMCRRDELAAMILHPKHPVIFSRGPIDDTNGAVVVS